MQGFVHIEQNLAFFVFGGDRLAGGISFSPYKPKSVIRISLCRTAKRNPNDRFGFKIITLSLNYILPPPCKA